MEKLELKKEEPKIESLYQLLDFLEEEFGENITKELFKLSLEQRAQADRVIGDHAKPRKVRLDRLKNTEVSPITIARLNNIIDARSRSLEIDLRYPERFEKNIRKEKKEMFRAIKDKEIVMDGKGNIEVKTLNSSH